MAPPSQSLLLILLLSAASSFFFSAFSVHAQTQLPQIPNTQIYLGRRTLLAKPLKQDNNDDDDDDVDEKEAHPLPNKKKVIVPVKDEDDHDSSLALSKKNKKTSSSSKDEQKKNSQDEEQASLNKINKLQNDAKLIKTKTSSSKNQTKLIDSKTGSSKNQTKLINPKTGSSKNQTKLNKPIGGLASSKNKTKLIKPTTSKDHANNTNSTSKSNSPNLTKSSKSPPKPNTKSTTLATAAENKQKAPPPPATWNYDSDDLVSEFRDLPAKFQQTFIPDLHRISTTSQNYLTKANREMTKNIKPYVGNRFAPSLTIGISVGIVLLPLLIISLIFTKVKAYFSLQRLIILTQIYLSIYFSTLCLSSLLTGLEPLKFFYATSQTTYVWVQVFQTLGYVIYLSMMLMYLILVFSTETSLGQKGLGLAQTCVGFAIGLHYYVTVFHKVVLRQPPRTNWKVHGIYATCFLVICLFARAERRKKAYLVEGGEQGKTS